MEEDVELADRFLAAYWRTSPVELDDHQNINVKITITSTIPCLQGVWECHNAIDRLTGICRYR